MYKEVVLSADEKSVLLFCLESYRRVISDSDNTVDQLLASLTLSKKRAAKLMQDIYDQASLSAELCEELRTALWAWRITKEGSQDLVSEVDRKLRDAF